ncbi:prepilin-type N-terminal cleavage/methylation domain-containing protein [Aneurinibacillus sp. Ricciae_BoGa-3]|uniref:type IV pilus modification PilV family protein n=1 Tax=Aneurinibacillus sp. Ricciae_BoGa-3 TaxID=3022697 RepID=UPI00233F7F73|nr:prepilin-type N-terminal cleavage/methylation domain-containing protein [Aneurinibacillus sp. Ricciae_BoGa-3]WCK53657.1 prepilin-type N-terminal cleavage/methylation domain-containing protein [Aneurinibacillus sp. Ricciae_BoGa-3]
MGRLGILLGNKIRKTVLYRNQRGFSLIEILSSIVILSIVVLIFSNFSGSMLLSTIKSDDQTQAILKTDGVLNQLRNSTNLANDIAEINNANYAGQKFAITVNKQSITSSSTIAFPAPSPVRKNHLSSSTVVVDGSVPCIIAVTVSWGS